MDLNVFFSKNLINLKQQSLFFSRKGGFLKVFTKLNCGQGSKDSKKCLQELGSCIEIVGVDVKNFFDVSNTQQQSTYYK